MSETEIMTIFKEIDKVRVADTCYLLGFLSWEYYCKITDSFESFKQNTLFWNIVND